jgi:hypothetical protein
MCRAWNSFPMQPKASRHQRSACLSAIEPNEFGGRLIACSSLGALVMEG